MIVSYDSIVSTLRDEPATEVIYSLLASYGGRRGGELPGTWFLEALGPLGHRPAAVRQALFRMTRGGELEARKEGRLAWYRLSPFGRAATATGTSKLFDPPAASWDGAWTLVCYQFDTGSRGERDAVREILELEGFALLARGTYVHPHERTRRVLELTHANGLGRRVTVFRARRIGGEADAALAGRLWDLRRLGRDYRRFLRRFGPLARRPARRWPPAGCFALRLAVVCHYLRTAWDDPDLPRRLLPGDWAGHQARAVAAQLYRDLLPRTLRHGDDLAARVGVLDRLDRPAARPGRGTHDGTPFTEGRVS